MNTARAHEHRNLDARFAGTPGWQRYGVAVAVTVAAAALRYALGSTIGVGFSFILAFPAAMVSAWYGGLGPGLASTAISSVGVLMVFEAGQPLWRVDLLARLAIFCFSGTLISLLSETLHRATARAEREAIERGDAEEWLAQAQALAHIGTWELDLTNLEDRDANELRWSDECFRVFGYEPGAVAVTNALFFDAVHPDDRASVVAAVTQALDRHEAYHIEHWLRRPDGAERYVQQHGTIVRDEADRPLRILGTCQDVTERKLAELALRRAAERAERLRSLAVALAQALTEDEVTRVIIDQGLEALGAIAGCVVRAADGGRTLQMVQSVGYDPEAIRDWQRFSIDTDAPLAQAARTRAPVFVASPDERAQRYPALPSFLHRQPMVASASIPMVIGDRLLGGLGLVWAAASALQNIDRELLLGLTRQCAQALERAQLYAAEQQARARAEASDRAKDQFLAVLSHELRTPLTPVLGAAAMLESDASASAEVRRLAAMIRKNAALEARLIDDLLDLTRVREGKLSLHLEAVDAHAQIEDVLRTCAAEIEARGLRVALSLAAADHQVHGDQARLQQVIWNLVKNAAKFSHAGGRIAIRTANDAAGMLTIEVEDEGIGIEPELQPRLFHAFEQGSREVTRQFGGLGLGLAISKALIDAQGGAIAAASAGKDRGATFTLRVPLARAQAATVQAGATPAPAAGRRILLVEDHADTAELMAELLTLHGYAVKTANSVASALRLADTESFDLVLSDLGLPDGTGHDLMRALGARRPLPGVALSGFGFEKDVQEARAAGFREHLTKPVNPAQLLRVLAVVLDESAGRRA
jgi:PAS domain S-box-containing protein